MISHICRRLAATLFIFSIASVSWGETESCTELRSVLESSKTDFKEHRSGARFFNRVTIWDTDLALAGLESQVWQWGMANYSFVATRAIPMQQAGADFLRQTTESLKNCLGKTIHVVENASPVKNGVHTKIRSSEDKRRIDMFLVRNDGLFRDSWTFYFMVTGAKGYPLPSLEQGVK